MKKKMLIFPAIFLAFSLFLPSAKARAVGPGYDHPDNIIAYFCGTQFYYEATDYPAHIVGIVLVESADGANTADYEFWLDAPQPNAQWQDAGFLIGALDVVWGTPSSGQSSFFVEQTSCPAPGLINMYVYYSETPFFGQTHTITIMSAAGFPSKGTVTALAGGKLPDGFVYGPPACWGPLIDDGTDRGQFACDSFLSSVGERRANLRNDPQGSDFDLLPKINQYLGVLDELGITPDLPSGFTGRPFDLDIFR